MDWQGFLRVTIVKASKMGKHLFLINQHEVTMSKPSLQVNLLQIRFVKLVQLFLNPEGIRKLQEQKFNKTESGVKSQFSLTINCDDATRNSFANFIFSDTNVFASIFWENFLDCKGAQT